MQTTRFLITGVGGQGTILASDVLAEVGLRLGYDAKKSDILGLAVRGGSVVSHIIWSDKVRAPMIDEGSADYYISFEWLEGLRRMAYTNPDTMILANDWRIDPITVVTGVASYPDGILDTLKEQRDTIVVEATKEAKKMGAPRAFNVIVLGAAARHMGFEKEDWISVIETTVPPKTIEVNKKAFDAGYALEA